MRKTTAKKNIQKDSKSITQIEELNWKQIDSLEREKTIIFLPISPLEEHGPHLPVGTDFLTSKDAAKEAMKRLQEKDPTLSPVLYPSVPLGFTKIAGDFPGTVSVSSKAIRDVIFGICTSLGRHGFKYILICSYHMDLGHLKGIYAGMKKAQKRYPLHVYEPQGPYHFSKQVEEREPKLGFDTTREVHAGFRETSLMKYQYPYLVDPCYKDLQNIYKDLYSPKALGKTFQELGLPDGYVGSPARADSDYGRWLFEDTVELYVRSALGLLHKETLPALPKSTQRVMKSLFWL
jgi:creatinine amidohydrolase